MKDEMDFWGLPMNWRIRTMWALGNLAAVLVALAALVRPLAYVYEVAVAIWHDAQVQAVPDLEPRPIREPGWVLRDYKERMNRERRADVVDRGIQGGLSGRVVRSTPARRAFAWPG